MLSISTIILFVIILATYWCYDTYTSLQRNIKAAKESGLPYVVVPVNLYNRLWLVFGGLLLPHLRKLPMRWTENWLEYVIISTYARRQQISNIRVATLSQTGLIASCTVPLKSKATTLS